MNLEQLNHFLSLQFAQENIKTSSYLKWVPSVKSIPQEKYQLDKHFLGDTLTASSTEKTHHTWVYVLETRVAKYLILI